MTRRHPWNRLLAWILDWLCILVWVAVVAAVGIPLYLAGVTRSIDAISGNVLGFVTLVAPITLALAWRESSPKQATPGKRARRLTVGVSGTGARASFGRALIRNAFKIALPWELGHTVAFTLATGGGVVPAWIVPVIALTYALPLVYLVTLFLGDGRTVYDRIAGTVVILTD